MFAINVTWFSWELLLPASASEEKEVLPPRRHVVRPSAPGPAPTMELKTLVCIVTIYALQL